MIIPLVKANGNHNSFIIIDKHSISNICITKSIAQNICLNYGKPIVDGLIVIEKININNYKVDYYNNDGTWETLCINSLRCVGLLLYNKYNLKSLIAHCGDGKHIINVKNSNNIKVSMNKPIYKSDKIDIDGYLGYYLFAGAKHFVINYLEDWPDNKILKGIAEKIRYNKFFSNGVNVNFYKIINNQLDVITYEKGIEKIMSSCASGSFACAYHSIFVNKIKIKNIYITNPVGELFVYIDLENNKYHISGSAEIEKEEKMIFKE